MRRAMAAHSDLGKVWADQGGSGAPQDSHGPPSLSPPCGPAGPRSVAAQKRRPALLKC